MIFRWFNFAEIDSMPEPFVDVESAYLYKSVKQTDFCCKVDVAAYN